MNKGWAAALCVLEALACCVRLRTACVSILPPARTHSQIKNAESTLSSAKVNLRRGVRKNSSCGCTRRHHEASIFPSSSSRQIPGLSA
jgi:hypothetical protein